MIASCNFINNSCVCLLWGSVVLIFLDASRWSVVCESVYIVLSDLFDNIRFIASITAKNSPMLFVHIGYGHHWMMRLFVVRSIHWYSMTHGLPIQEASTAMLFLFRMDVFGIKLFCRFFWGCFVCLCCWCWCRWWCLFRRNDIVFLFFLIFFLSSYFCFDCKQYNQSYKSRYQYS